MFFLNIVWSCILLALHWIENTKEENNKEVIHNKYAKIQGFAYLL